MGVSWSKKQALEKLLGESLERYSIVRPTRIESTKTIPNRLDNHFIYPHELDPWEESYYRMGNSSPDIAAYSGEEGAYCYLSPDKPCDTVIVNSLINKGHFKYVHLDSISVATASPYCKCWTNGMASGTSLDRAAVSGLLELIERDHIGIWWYNKLKLPGINLNCLSHEHDWEKIFTDIGRVFWLIDVTLDLGVNVIACISTNTKYQGSSMILGFGAGSTIGEASSKAILENYGLAIGDTLFPPLLPMSDRLWWFQVENVKEIDFLNPCRNNPENVNRKAVSYKKVTALLTEARIHPYLFLYPSVFPGLATVKVLASGFMTFLPQFRQGRLYQVPVTLGIKQNVASYSDYLDYYPLFT